jgi:hypothetical protein
VQQKLRTGAGIRFILALAAVPSWAWAEQPPTDLARRVAQRATETRQARDNYTYRQSVRVDELSPSGASTGEYREVREVIFSPHGERTERLLGIPLSRLTRLRLTEEDFQDIRQVQPFLFESQQLRAYETQFKGEETMDGVDCWVLQVRPRQILAGQRLFDGLLWVAKSGYDIVRSQGRAEPQLRSTKQENLFPHFTTLWGPVEGGYRFPVYTHADDTLDFRVGPQRIRLIIRYTDYRRFTAETTVKYNP